MVNDETVERAVKVVLEMAREAGRDAANAALAERKLRDLHSQLDKTETDANIARNIAEDLKDDVEFHKSRADGLQEQVKAMDADGAALAERNEELAMKLGDLEVTFTQQNNDFGKALDHNAELEAEVAQLHSVISNQHGEIGSLKEERDDTNELVATLEEQAEAARTRIQTLETALANMTERAEELESTIESMAYDIHGDDADINLHRYLGDG